jgi:hypothetical protein
MPRIRVTAYQCRTRQMKGWAFMELSPDSVEAIRLYLDTGDASRMIKKPNPIITEENYRNTIYYY